MTEAAADADLVVYTPPETGRQFMLSNAMVRLLLGPIGSGKSTVCCMDIFKRCAEMPRSKDGLRHSRWAVVRNTRPQLKSTTLKTWFQWFPNGVAGTWKESDSTFYLQVGDIRAEIMFLPLDTPDDAKRLLSLELTGAWLNEVREIAPEIITAAFSRLGRFPSKATCAEPYWHGLIMDTNPPGKDSWLHEQFEGDEKPPGWELFKQPGGLEPDAENRENLPPTYYEDMMHGATQDWIDVHVHGKYGRSLIGRPVYENSFKATFHTATAPLIALRASEYPIVIGMDFGRCYDDQTEVLTRAGWKWFKDVREDEQVATLHPETRAFEYTPINFKTEYDYSGDMLTWQGTNIDLCVTPEHRFPHTRRDSPDTLRWASAEEVAGQMSAHRYAIVAPRAWEGVAPKGLPLGMSALHYATFLGWWMADGCVERATNRVTISQKKPAPGLDALADALCSYGVVCSRLGSGLRFSNATLARHLRVFGGKHARTRRVPDSIRFAPREVIEAFVMAYTAGDGHIRKPNREGGAEEHTVWFNNAATAGQFQELAQKLGWGSALRSTKGGTSTFAGGRKASCAGGWTVSFKKNWERVELNPSQFTRRQYDGKIYCLNVPYHTLCVRRNGKVSWNGNTPAAAIGQRDHRGRVLLLDELFVENVGLETFLTKHLRPFLSAKYPGNRFFVVGDPAGWAKSQVNEDSCKDVLTRCGFMCVPAPTNDPVKRIAAVEGLLVQQVEGQAMFLISPTCKMILQGFDGSYHYKRRTDGSYEVSANKNRYSHLADAVQYFALGSGATAGIAIDAGKRRPVVQAPYQFV